jgi:uncharacterized protein with von Willebrand factor type A (vWA) domain
MASSSSSRTSSLLIIGRGRQRHGPGGVDELEDAAQELLGVHLVAPAADRRAATARAASVPSARIGLEVVDQLVVVSACG